MNFVNFFQAVAMIASQQVDPFELDWEEAHLWRELQDAYMAWQEQEQPPEIVSRPAEIQTVEFQMNGKKYQTVSSWSFLD